jgi:threonyl-tRNA synthetase
MLVVGEKERVTNTVSVRKHKEGDKGALSLSEFINNIKDIIKNKS